MEDGGPQQRQGGTRVGRAAADRLEQLDAAATRKDRSRGASRHQRADGRLPPKSKGGTDGGLAFASHVVAFIQERLQQAKGSSLGATDLRVAYEAWCAARGHIPLSMVKLAAGLTRLSYRKRKSNGRIHYRDVQLAA